LGVLEMRRGATAAQAGGMMEEQVDNELTTDYINDSVDKYMKRNYPVAFTHGHDGWFVKILHWPGCMSQGDTFEETCANIVEAAELWLRVSIEDDCQIPDPDWRKPVFYDDYTALILLPFVVRLSEAMAAN
jgi:predicted RNase H-like HicB family nuclease